MGLSPLMTQQVFDVLLELKKQGMTILLVEQNAYEALTISDRAYIMETGNITLEGRSSELIHDPRVKGRLPGWRLMSAEYIISQLINGLRLGSVYAIVAVGILHCVRHSPSD